VNYLDSVGISIDYFSQSLTILRSNAPALNEDTGVFERDNTTSVSIRGAVLNLTYKDLQALPEGERSEGMISLYTKDAVQTTQDSDFADLLVWRGEHYKLVKPIYREIGKFSKVLCKRYNIGADDGV
jgi:hypothetical protein